MKGKLIEDVLNVQAVDSMQVTSAGTLYNGVAVSVTNNAIDTRASDNIVFCINAGEFLAGTLDCDIVESDGVDPAAATAITGAEFDQITTANDEGLHNGSITCKNYKRYFWARTYNSAGTMPFGIVATLAKNDSDPQSNSPVFDLNHA